MRNLETSNTLPIRERIGIHVGEVLVELPHGRSPSPTPSGIHVDICHAVLSLANPGQILLTRFAYDSARQALKSPGKPHPDDLVWATHGTYQIEGAETTVDICEVAERQDLPLRPPPGNQHVKRGQESNPTASPSPPRPDPGLWKQLRSSTPAQQRNAWTGSLLVALLGVLFLVSRGADGASYDWSYLFKPDKPVDDVIIIGIDDTSISTLASGPRRSLATWDRSLYTRILNRLTDAGARTIVFDVLFEDPKGAVMTNGFIESATDREFKSALDRSGRAFLAAHWMGDQDKVVAPSPLFRRAGEWGLVEQSPDASSVIRRPMHRQADVPPLAELLVASKKGPPTSTPANAWIRYYGPPGSIRSFSFLSALSAEDIPAAVISNKVVFVGGASRVAPDKDTFPTPYSRWRSADIHGVEVNATRYMNQLRNDWLHRLPVWIELAAVILLGAGGLFF